MEMYPRAINIIKSLEVPVLEHLSFPLVSVVPSHLQGIEIVKAGLIQVFYPGPVEKGILVVLHFEDINDGAVGMVRAVPTHNIQMGGYSISPAYTVPAFLDWRLHGQPCQTRSALTHGEEYPMANQEQLWGIIDEVHDEIPYPSRHIRRKFLTER